MHTPKVAPNVRPKNGVSKYFFGIRNNSEPFFSLLKDIYEILHNKWRPMCHIQKHICLDLLKFVYQAEKLRLI